jgi:lipid II:glycine glycyltransferase (peptidoglycan interpeptide bridge formation enzyme)
MILILTKQNIALQQWQQLVETSPTASFFQTKECFDFYASLSFLKPFVFGVSENEKLVGLVCGYVIADGGRLKQFFSRRAIVPGGLLLDKQISAEALNKLLDFSIKALKKKAIYIELRNYNDYSQYKNIFEQSKFKYQPHLNFHVQTTDTETAFSQLSTTKRRDIRISKKEGAEIVEINRGNHLNDYYELLKKMYSTKVHTPLFPFEFFEKIVKLPECRIFGIKFDDKIIGGSVCVLHANCVVYEWFCCGLDGKFKNIYPSTLAVWAGIEFAAKNGFKYFDMMGAGKPNESYGVREFKAKFGGTQVEHGRFLCVAKPLFYNLGKKAIQIVKKRT